MSDPLNGIKQVVPSWPVRPTAPAREEKPGDRRKTPERPEPDADHDADNDNDQTRPTIDEYI